MKRTILITLILFTAVSARADDAWLKSIEAAQKEAKRSNQLILAEMYADWCGWCKKMAAELFPSKSFREATRDMVLLQVDTEDRGEGQQLAMRFGISRLPTVVLFTHDLEVAGVIEGYSPPGPWVDQLIAARTGYQDFLVRLKKDDNGKRDPESTYQLAGELIQRRRFTEAENKLTILASLTQAPIEVRGRAMIDLGRLALMNNRLSEAVSTFEMAASMKGLEMETSAQAHILLAEVHMESQRFDEALRELELIRKRYPESQAATFADRYLPSVRARLGIN